MQIQRTNGTTQNFGISCPAALKARLFNCVPDNNYTPIFRNGRRLVEELENIGSPNTKLEGLKIKRRLQQNSFDGDTEIVDTLYMKFKMLTERGKTESVCAKISSDDGVVAKTSVDIYDDFKKVVNMAEEEFLRGYMAKLVKKGKLTDSTVAALSELYPGHKAQIPKIADIQRERFESGELRGILNRIVEFIFT